MSIVFVAGSRQISQIPAEVMSRRDTMIEKGFQILVGDAKGADKAVQRTSPTGRIRTSSCTAWRTTAGTTLGTGPLASSFPSWRQGLRLLLRQGLRDGAGGVVRIDALGRQEQGTVNNVNLARDHGPVVVYVVPTGEFRTIRVLDDLGGFLREAIQTAWSESSPFRAKPG